MPFGGMFRVVQRHYCEKKYGWSTLRGGCRFERNHKGDCKPGRYR